MICLLRINYVVFLVDANGKMATFICKFIVSKALFDGTTLYTKKLYRIKGELWKVYQINDADSSHVGCDTFSWGQVRTQRFSKDGFMHIFVFQRFFLNDVLMVVTLLMSFCSST